MMLAGISPHGLARARAQAAGDLEAAITALGVAYELYQQTTQQLGDRLGADLARGVDTVLILHLHRAGLGPLLERKLTGVPAPLRVLVENQHARAIE